MHNLYLILAMRPPIKVGEEVEIRVAQSRFCDLPRVSSMILFLNTLDLSIRSLQEIEGGS